MANNLPSPLKAKCKELVQAGQTARQAAEQTGVKLATINVWSSREGWRNKPSFALIEKRVRADLTKQVDQHSEHSRARLAEEIREQIDKVRERKVPKLPSQLDDRIKTVEVLVKSASRLFGWENNTASSHLRLDILSRPIDLDNEQAQSMTHLVNDKLIEPVTHIDSVPVSNSKSEPVSDKASSPDNKNACSEPGAGQS